MIIDKLCMPAILYIGFTLTHIIIDLFNKLYNTAILKFVLMIIFTTMLNLLCRSGLTILSWIIVFMPFILLTSITLLLLFSLGLSPDKGFIKYEVSNDNDVNQEDIELTTNIPVENMFSM